MKRIKILAAPALLFMAFTAAPALKLMPIPGNPNPAAVQAGDYTIEPYHTRVSFAVSHMGFNDWFGDLTGASGSLSLDPHRATASHVDVTLPMASISTTNTKLDGELKSKDWFDADRFPTIHFVSTKVIKTGARTAKIAGDLTFHGVTRPVVLDAQFVGAGINPLSKAYTVGFHATTTIKRTAFGVQTYYPVIGDEVHIRISAAFERHAS